MCCCPIGKGYLLIDTEYEEGGVVVRASAPVGKKVFGQGCY